MAGHDELHTPFLQVVKMKQAPDGRPEFRSALDVAVSAPIPELPGPKLPGRQRLHPPLHPPIRRPVTEARPFLDVGLGLDDAPDDLAPDLARRLADHIDEFRLVSHGSLLAKCLAFLKRSSLLSTA